MDQLIDPLTLNQRVVGSSPTAPTNEIKNLIDFAILHISTWGTIGLSVIRGHLSSSPFAGRGLRVTHQTLP